MRNPVLMHHAMCNCRCTVTGGETLQPPTSSPRLPFPWLNSQAYITLADMCVVSPADSRREGLCCVSSECTHSMSKCMCYGKMVCCSVACIQQYKLCHVCAPAC